MTKRVTVEEMENTLNEIVDEGWTNAAKGKLDAIRACITEYHRLRKAVEGWKKMAKVVRPGALFQSPIADSMVAEIRDFDLGEK